MAGRSTRSGREYGGIGRHETLQLNFDLRTFAPDAAKRQADAEARQLDPLPDLKTHNPQPCPSHELSFTPIIDLALTRFTSKRKRPEYQPTTAAKKLKDVNGCPVDASSSRDRTTYRQNRAARRALENEASGSHVKGYQARRVQDAQTHPLKTTYMQARSGFGWTGPRDGIDGLKDYSLAELRSIGIEVVECPDPRQTLVVQDSAGGTLCVRGGHVSEDWMERIIKPFQNLFKALHEALSLPPSKCKRRGNHEYVNGGLSFGGGQTRPGTLCMSCHNEELLRNFRQDKATKAVVRAIDYYFRAYFPQLWNLYSNTLDKIYNDNPKLERQFENSAFAGYTLNFERVNCRRHRDYLNLLFGQCAILSLGDFDYKMGGHLVLWDLGLAFEFPPGCIMLIPSAILEHSNSAIRQSENRSSLALYSASGLFRWVHNGGMSDKDFAAHAPPDVLERWNKHRDELLYVGLDILHGKACKG